MACCMRNYIPSNGMELFNHAQMLTAAELHLDMNKWWYPVITYPYLHSVMVYRILTHKK